MSQMARQGPGLDHGSTRNRKNKATSSESMIARTTSGSVSMAQ